MTGIEEQENPSRSDAPLRRDAIILIPGIANDDPQLVSVVAERFADALRTNAPASFEVRVAADALEVAYGNQSSRCCTVECRNGDEVTRIFDIYGLQYRDSMVRQFTAKTAVLQALEFLWFIITHVHYVWTAVIHPAARAKGFFDRLQATYIYLIALVMLVYTGVLLGAASTVVTGVLQQAGLGEVGKLMTWLSMDWAATVFSVLTALGLIAPDAIGQISRIAISFHAVTTYLADEEHRPHLLKRLSNLLTYISGRNPGYRRTHVIAYSFGSVIALDAIHPHWKEPGSWRGKIDTLVTVGCPYDIIRTVWPGYFQRRHRGDIYVQHWANIYIANDVFGSNFREDMSEGSAASGVEIALQNRQLPTTTEIPASNLRFRVAGERSTGAWDLLPFRRAREHTRYWDANDPDVPHCFHLVADAILYGPPPMRALTTTQPAVHEPAD